MTRSHSDAPDASPPAPEAQGLAAETRQTGITLAIGGIGAALAFWLNFPAAMLVGPALCVTIAALAGVKVGIAMRVRDVCFLFLGISIGAGFVPEAGAAILRWPLAFVALLVTLAVTIAVGGWVLRRFFGFDPVSAVLAAAPGHLSFVLSLSADMGGDIGRVVIVQSLRLLTLTLVVPFLAVAMGYEVPAAAMAPGDPMPLWILAMLVVLGIAVGAVFNRLNFPAPLILGTMAVSGLGHVADLTPGTVHPVILIPAFVIMGTLIGTRFADMSWPLFRQSAFAGFTVTLIAAGSAAIGVIPVCWALGMELPHGLAAFAPGGLETMIVLGAILGAEPAFLAACHVVRLLILSVMIPVAVARASRRR
ncbi:AbrB family transcriptional regulator [Chachezhania antarctica]|uniref:AbrB family transcriptional regulator n=1 Tax=Chachezhania antarctica TaxID=2340860 RepID=UPI0013CE9799|nr:AbrB family transcriptional regulator [Chachezhania antarctica]